MSINMTFVGFIIILLQKILSSVVSPKCRYNVWAIFMIAIVFPVGINFNINMQIGYFMSTIWLIVLFGIILKNLIGYVLLNRKIGNNEIEENDICKILEKCKKKLKIKKNIKIIKQDSIKKPLIIGIFDVRIVFAESVLKFEKSEIENIIMHELAHYKRKDNIINYICLVIKDINWFNPIIKFIIKNIKNDMELVADEIATIQMNKEEKKNFSKVIIKVMENSKDKNRKSLTRKDVAERIDALFLDL